MSDGDTETPFEALAEFVIPADGTDLDNLLLQAEEQWNDCVAFPMVTDTETVLRITRFLTGGLAEGMNLLVRAWLNAVDPQDETPQTTPLFELSVLALLHLPEGERFFVKVGGLRPEEER